MSEIIQIFDTTLRDGEQSPGASMTLAEKFIFAQQLARLGVDIIEAGFAASSIGDFEAVQKIGHEIEGPRVVSLCRTRQGDIDRANEALNGSKKWGIHTFIATSDLHMKAKLKMDRKTVLEHAIAAVERARKYTDHVEFSAEDATRSDPAFLVEIFSAVIKAGANVLNVPDTVGYITPREYYDLIKRLKNEVVGADKIIFSVHCHNDLGLAVANSLAAVEAGAGQVECTVNGIGERAGNASVEEIAMVLKTRNSHYNKDTNIHTEQLYNSSKLLTKLTGIVVQPNKAIVGANAFAHEAGIHQDGVIKNALTYEIMRPESVGVPGNNLVMGKHSGRAALKGKIADLGFNVDEEELNRIFVDFKALADKKKVVYDEDIESILTQGRIQGKEKYSLVSANVCSGTETLPTATVILKIDDVIQPPQASFGDGPVDAALNTIKMIAGEDCILLSYVVNAITGGTDAQGEVSITIGWNGKRITGRGAHTDIVIASAQAFINALNRKETYRQKISDEQTP